MRGVLYASRTERVCPVPALPPYLIEPNWQQFSALLPEHRTDHSLGCHRPRIPERVVFEKLVQVLVFICAYERIDDASCLASEASPQEEAGVVHRKGGEGDRLLGGLLRCGDHRKAAHPRRLDPLPLGGATFSTTMSPIDGSSELSWLAC